MVFWLVPSVALGFQIGSVQYHPTWDLEDVDPEVPGSGTKVPRTPAVPSVDGVYESFKDASAPKALSRYLYIGCFEGPSLTPSFITQHPNAGDPDFTDTDTLYGDPNACIDYCTDPVRKKEAEGGNVYVAMKEHLCYCFFDNDLTIFSEVNGDRCGFSCGPFGNPLCGGQDSIQNGMGIVVDTFYYGIYKEFDYVSMASQGAYDPWRSIFYQVVVVKEQSISSAEVYSSMTRTPERYYLHAVSTDLGVAMFEFQIQLFGGILYGLQFDLDDSRLAAISISKETGRIPELDVPWEYKLALVTIDTTVAVFPVLTLTHYDLWLSGGLPAVSTRYMSFIGATGIFSKRGQDTLVFTQLASSTTSQDTEAKDMLYAVDIGDPDSGFANAGNVFYHVETDMKVLQIMINEARGTVTAIGPKDGKQVFRKFGTIIYDDQQIKTFQPNRGDNNYGSESTQYSDFYLLPAVCTSEHIGNWSIMGGKQLRDNWDPDHDEPIGQTFFKIHIDTGAVFKYCRPPDQDPKCETGVVDPQIPYAALYNREPRIPLSLPAAQMLSAKFTKDGTHVTILFDRITLKGSLPEDTNNDGLPDVINRNCTACIAMAAGEFDCKLVLDRDSVELVGEYDCGARCIWTQAGQAIVIRMCDAGTIEVGSSLALKPKVVYTLPPNEKPLRFSMPTAHMIRVTPPDGDLTPIVAISTDSTTHRVDQCSDMHIDAESTLGVGGKDRGTFEWTMFDSIKSTQEGVIEVDVEAEEKFLAELEKASLANAKILHIASDVMPISSVFPIQLKVTSRWGPEYFRIVKFVVEKLNYEAPKVSIEKNVTGEIYRHQGMLLMATCSPSLCNSQSVSPAKKYQWGQGEDSLPIAKWNMMPLTMQQLVLEPFTLDKNETYTFQVTCTLQGVSSGSTASIEFSVSRSPLVLAGFFQRKHQRGLPLVFDGSECYDPDEQFATGPQLQFQYTYSCVNDMRAPCYDVDPPTRELRDPPGCRFEESGAKLLVGGKAYPTPRFQGEQFCQISRGIIVMNTESWPEPDDGVRGGVPYTIGVTVVSLDGRTASEDIIISLTKDFVPDVVLPRNSFTYDPVLEGCDRVPRSATIRVAGSVNLGDVVADTIFRWEIKRKMLRDVRHADGTTTASYKYEPTDIDTKDSSKFHQSEGSLEIAPDVFEEGVEYLIRLYASVEFREGSLAGEAFEGHADLTFAVAFYPASSGTLNIDAKYGEMGMEREIWADNWKAAREPILYSFAALKCLDTDCTELTRSSIGPPDKLRKRFKVGTNDNDWLPKGDPNNDFMLIIEATITAFCSTPVTSRIEIVSRPPADPGATLHRMSVLVDSTPDPNEAINLLSSMVNILDDSDKSKEYASDILNQALSSPTDENIILTSETIAKGFDLVSGVIKMTGDDMSEDDKNNAVTLMEVYSANDMGNDAAAMAFAAIDALIPPSTAGLIGTGDREQAEFHSVIEDEDTVTTSSNILTSASVTDLRGRAAQSRQDYNHGRPLKGQTFIDDCMNDYCDLAGISCVFETDAESIYLFRCCTEPNVHTICNEPPCWFAGSKCPEASTPASSSQRRMEGEEGPRVQLIQKAPTAQQIWFQEYQRTAGRKDIEYDPLYDSITEHAKLYEDLRKLKANFVRNQTQIRRLDVKSPERESLDPLDLLKLEDSEPPLVDLAKNYIAEKIRVKNDEVIEEAKKEVLCHLLAIKDPDDCELLKMVERRKREAKMEAKFNKDRFNSQLTSRLFAVRDRVCKTMLGKIKAPNLSPMKFTTRGFQVWLGKRTSLMNLLGRVRFPSSFVVEAPNSFSYAYFEYKNNPYSWSESCPPTDKTVIMTLLIYNGTTLDDVRIFDQPIPVRVFADKTLFSNGLCMFWNRFASDSSGGAWSTQGIFNDGNGCLTTHLTDLGIFLDGNLPTIFELHEAATYYKPRTIDRLKLTTVGILGMVILFNIVLMSWGYLRDEKVREGIRRGVIPFQEYHFDGDGVTVPLNVNDPIAYKWSHLRNPLFINTFWNVVKRDHLIVATCFYHIQFSRPQRILCFLALACGIMGLNAVIYGNPDKVASGEQYVVSGIFSALLMFPVYCTLHMMFDSRPTLRKKSLIRRSRQTNETGMLKRETDRLEHKSNMGPTGEQYAALPPPPPMGRSANTAVLALPPILPPNMPQNPMRPPPGVLALPPPPSGPNGVQPPPPRYPPPPGTAGPGAQPVPQRPPGGRLPPIFFSGNTPSPPPPLALGAPGALGTPGPAVRSGGVPVMGVPPPPPGEMKALPPVPNLEEISKGPAPPTPPMTRPPTGQMTPPMPPKPQFEGAHNAPAPDSARSASRTAGTPGPPPPPPPPAPPGPGAGGVVMPGSIASPRSPTFPPPSTRTLGLSTPKNMMPTLLQGMAPEVVVTRGQPPSMLAPPFPSTRPPAPPNVPLPGGAAGGMPGGAPPGAAPSFTPTPPPPPREDEAQFIRRVRMVYMDRVTRESQKLELLEQEQLGKLVPTWVYHLATFIPYMCCTVFLTASSLITMAYGVKFDTWQQEKWDFACMVAIVVVVFVLEMIRVSITTIVELRKFEIRKKAKAGDFAVRRVKKGDDDSPSRPPAALLRSKQTTGLSPHKTPIAPPVPMKYGMRRPSFLPGDEAGPMGAAALPPKPPPAPPEGAVPIIRPPGNRVPPSPPMTPVRNRMPSTPPPPPGASPPHKPAVPPINIDGPLLPGKLANRGPTSPANSQASRLSHQLQDTLRSRVAPNSGRSTASRLPPPPPPVMSPNRRQPTSPTGSTSSHPKPPSIPPPSGSSSQRAKMRRTQNT